MNWYVVYTQAQKEVVARRNLANQGFETYLPRYNRRCRHARRVYSVLAPLFPRYLFVRMDPKAQRWRSINGTLGVSYLLSEGPEPLPISDAVIDTIRSHEDSGLVRISPPAFARGQRICVTDGPFADIMGLFECVDDQQRVVLLLEFMGRTVQTRLPGHAVTAA